MVNAQQWLESQYNTEEKRKNVTNLDISGWYEYDDRWAGKPGWKKLKGALDLSDFPNLKSLDCSYNEITSLNLTNCVNLKNFFCPSNLLTSLNLSKNVKLEELWIGWNRFSKENPAWLSHLVNLKELNLQGSGFTGSLEFTKNMSKLEKLTMWQTDFTNGLEYLPLSLKEINFDGKINEELKFYNYDLTLWKVAHPKLMQKTGKEPVIIDYDYTKVEPQKMITVPSFLQGELTKSVTHSENLNPQLNYSDFLLRDGRPFSWETPFAETLEFWQENLSDLIENFSFDKFQEWKEQLGFNTLNKFKSLLLSVENKEKFWEENEVKSFEELIANSSPKEVITRIRKFNYEQSSDKSEKEEKIKQYYKLAEDQSLTEEQINSYLYKKVVGEIVDLPTRLYNVEKGKNKLGIRSRVELEKDVERNVCKEGEERFPINENIQRYATMSYVCGELKGEGEIYANARKALNKVIKTLELINQDKKEEDKINHVWIDQLSIIQDGEAGRIDKGKEIPRMRQYYNDSEVTLIAIDAEIGNEVNKENEVELTKHILKKIVTSPWFTRSWCFQEGLLGKQTIFMFDDYLADGRILALAWSNLRKDAVKSLKLSTTPQILVTPLGLSYGAQPKQNLNLTLGEALLAVKHREQTVPIDGVYALLGLFPYGKNVKVGYKGKTCSCDEEVRKNCTHWPTYSEEELEQVLLEVVKEIIGQGHGQEIFSWIGLSSSNSSWPIIPQVQVGVDGSVNGSTKVEKLHDYQLKNMQVSLQGIQLTSEVYRIDEVPPRGESYTIYPRLIGKIPIRSKEIRLDLKKNPETFSQIQVGDSLIVISEGNGDSLTNIVDNKTYYEYYSYLTVLIPRNPNLPIDLVEIYLKVKEKKPIPQKIFADLVNRRIIFGNENIENYQKLTKESQSESVSLLVEWNKWKNTREEFTQELVQKWKDNNFTYEQVCEWAGAFSKDFYPQEIDFYTWLRDKKKLTPKECEGETITKLELRSQLIIECKYPQFKQSQLLGISNEKYKSFNKSFNDLITIGRNLNWTKIEAILIREIRINSRAKGSINSIQFTYRVKSEGKWKLIEGERHGYESDLATIHDSVIIKLAKGEYLTKLKGENFSGRVGSLALHTINSQGEQKIYEPYGKLASGGKEFSLEIDNDKQASVFWGNIDRGSALFDISIQQTSHQITNEDLELIAQVEIPTSNQN